MTAYRAFCKAHPEFVPAERDEYAAAVDDLTVHYADAHDLGVATIEDDGQDGSTDLSTVVA